MSRIVGTALGAICLACLGTLNLSCSTDGAATAQQLPIDTVYRDTIPAGKTTTYSFVPTSTGVCTVYAFHYLQGGVDCVCNLNFVYNGKSTYSNNMNVFPIPDCIANRQTEFSLSNPGGNVTFDLIVVLGDGSEGSIAAPKELALDSTYEIDISNQQSSYYSFQTTTSGVYQITTTQYYRACQHYNPSNDIAFFSDPSFSAPQGLSTSLPAGTRYYIEAFVTGTEFCKTDLTVSSPQ